VRLEVLRDGEKISVELVTQKLESRVGEEREFKNWGLSVRDVTRALALDRRLDDDTGVIVTSVTSGFPSDKAEIEDGDVIVRLDGKPVADLDAFAIAYDALAGSKQASVLVELRRGRGVRSAVLKLQ
jgi:S1-C subfamily serine protease